MKEFLSRIRCRRECSFLQSQSNRRRTERIGRYHPRHTVAGLVGYFEGIDSERGLEWRCSDSLSLRAFLRLGSRDRVPDHSWLSRSRTRLPHEVHAAVFD